MRSHHRLSFLPSIPAVFALVACSGEKASAPPTTTSPPPAGPSTPEGSTPPAKDPAPPRSGSSRDSDGKVVSTKPGAEGTDPAKPGMVRGVALFQGSPPARPEIAMGSTVGCAEHHSTPPLSERLIVTDGKLANVFVYVSRGLEDWERPAPPTEPLVVRQTGCIYTPHLSFARSGQKLLVENGDGIAHNVHMKSLRNGDSNKTQAKDSPPAEFELSEPEMPITLACDIHPWMKAFVCVQDHPFAVITTTDGGFAIEGLPPGKYTISAWHEAFKTQRVEVTVPAGGEVELQYSFSE